MKIKLDQRVFRWSEVTPDLSKSISSQVFAMINSSYIVYVISLFLLIAVASPCLGQSIFEQFKSEFKELSFPIVINAPAESKEIPAEMVEKYFVDLDSEDLPRYREYFYQGRFENEKYTGLIITRYATSGAAGAHQNDIILLTFSPEGKVMAHFVLGTFWYNHDMGTMSADYNELLILIYADAKIRTKSIMVTEALDDSHTSLEEPINSAFHVKMQLDELGQVSPGIYKYELASIELQSEDYPLYAVLNKDLMKDYKLLFGNSPDILEKKRAFLQEYIDLEDPLANYLYAQTYDQFQFGIGDSTDAEMALEYFHNAADLNYTVAHEQLYYIYTYEFMGVEADLGKAIYHLEKHIETSYGEDKAEALFELARKYDPRGADVKSMAELWDIELNIDSTIAILNRAIETDSSYYRPFDYLGSIYDDQGNREKAIECYMQSSNLSVLTQAGTWLANGDGVEQDLDRGVAILLAAADEVAKIDFYQGGYNPINVLRELHYCSKLISKDTIKDHDQGYFICD